MGMIAVQARQCPYRPEDDPPAPIGMYHCDRCACVVISRMEHGPCFPAYCPAADEGWHPGPLVTIEVNSDDLPWLGLAADGTWATEGRRADDD